MTMKPNAQVNPRPPRVPAGKKGAAGAKMLLTTTALAATLGGWAMLTGYDAASDTTTSQATLSDASSMLPEEAQGAAIAEPDQSINLDLPPLPTLVPLVKPRAQPTAEPVKPIVAAPPTVQPTAQPTTQPQLRVVTRPASPSASADRGGGNSGAPQPAAKSRSSK